MVSMLPLITIGSRVLVVFPDYEFEPHLHAYFFTLDLTLKTPKKYNGSYFKPFSNPLNMKRLSSGLVAFSRSLN
jgi:hypothetical protein